MVLQLQNYLPEKLDPINNICELSSFIGIFEALPHSSFLYPIEIRKKSFIP
jgi:hypothetical protein